MTVHRKRPRHTLPPAPTALAGSALRGWLWLLAVLGLGALAFASRQRWLPPLERLLAPPASRPAAPARSVPVGVATARRGDLPIYLDAPGTVVALNTVTLRTRVDGQIMKVNYPEGRLVKAGDLLLQIDPRPFQVQLMQAQGQLAKDEAALSNARLDLVRYTQAGRAATQQQLDTAKATVAQDEGAIKTDQAQVENAKLQLTYCEIRAPISGKIGLRLVDEGNIVHAADSGGLAVITQVEPITVIFSLAEDALPQVLRASPDANKLMVDVLGRDKTQRLTTGTLTAVDSQIDLATLTAKFKATCDNKEHILFPNQAVNVRLRVDTRRNAVLIPAAGVQHSPTTTFAYVVAADQAVALRPVRLGPQEGGTAVIEDGLAPGEVVVTDGVDKLEPGMKVTVPEK